MILLFEEFKPDLEFNNNVKKHLEQFPYLTYSINDKDGLYISFGGTVSFKYVKGIMTPYTIEIVTEKPLKVKVTGKKNISDFEEFNGKLIIGNIEKIDIPKLKIKDIEVKVDTGATTSSLHCSWINVDTKSKKVHFLPLDKSYPQFQNMKYTFPLSEQVKVQSSNGEEEVRPLIKVDIVIKGRTYETFFSLTNRKELEYPILLGKDIISGNFLVDPSYINENISEEITDIIDSDESDLDF